MVASNSLVASKPCRMRDCGKRLERPNIFEAVENSAFEETSVSLWVRFIPIFLPQTLFHCKEFQADNAVNEIILFYNEWRCSLCQPTNQENTSAKYICTASGRDRSRVVGMLLARLTAANLFTKQRIRACQNFRRFK